MKRELVTTLLTLSLLASSLPANALAAEHAAPVLQQTQEASGSRDGESLPGEEADGEEALSGVFAFGGDTYDTMAEAFEAAASGGTVTYGIAHHRTRRDKQSGHLLRQRRQHVGAPVLGQFVSVHH